MVCHIPLTLSQCQHTPLYLVCTFKVLSPCPGSDPPQDRFEKRNENPNSTRGDRPETSFLPSPLPHTAPEVTPGSFPLLQCQACNPSPKKRQLLYQHVSRPSKVRFMCAPQENKCVSRSSSDTLDVNVGQHLSANNPRLYPRDALEGGGGTPPPRPSRACSLCPATVSLTASAGFNGICNRQ